LLDPSNAEVIIPPDDAALVAVVYTPEDEAFMRNTFARHLRHDFGYGHLDSAVAPECEPSNATV